MRRKLVFISISFFLLFQNALAFPMKFYEDTYPSDEVHSEEFLPPWKHHDYNHNYYHHRYPYSYDSVPHYTPNYVHHHEPYHHHHHHHHDYHHHDRFYHPIEQPFFPPVQYPVYEPVQYPTMEVYPPMKNQEMMNLYKLLDLIRIKPKSDNYDSIVMAVIEPEKTEYGSFIPMNPIEFQPEIETEKPIEFEQIDVNSPLEFHQIEVELTPMEIETVPEVQTGLFDENLSKPEENLFTAEDINSFDEKFNKFIESPVFQDYLENQFSNLKTILGKDSKFKDLFDEPSNTKDEEDQPEITDFTNENSETSDDDSVPYELNIFKLLMAPFVNIPEVADQEEEQVTETYDNEEDIAESAVSGLDTLMFIASKLPSKIDKSSILKPTKEDTKEDIYNGAPENYEDNEIDNDWVKVSYDQTPNKHQSSLEKIANKEKDMHSKDVPVPLNYNPHKNPMGIHWY